MTNVNQIVNNLRDYILEIIQFIIGAERFGAILSILTEKHSLSRFYSNNHCSTIYERQRCIAMIDGKLQHGGLSDRLRGIVSLYHYCKLYNKEFKLFYVSPFLLSDYLIPNKYDWIIDQENINFSDSCPVVIRPFSLSDEVDSLPYFNRRINSYREFKDLHIYTNITIAKESFCQDFNELFKPSPKLASLLEWNLDRIGSKYISITFRFQQLLGDLKEDNFLVLDTEKRNMMIRKCCDFIQKVHINYPQIPVILITSDSSTFLKTAAESFDFVYTIPGNVLHMDYTSDKDNFAYIKSFLDMLIISRAEIAFSYSTGQMYRNSAFAQTSALIGNVPFKKIVDNG